MPADYDIFRDSTLRYLGYSNELGEAFRPLVNKSLVRLSYGVAFGYVFSDTIHKGYQVWNTKADHPSKLRHYLVAEQAVDTLIWQTMASVLIPGYAIHKCVDLSKYVLSRCTTPTAIRPMVPYIPTAFGLAMIPLIIHPIDYLVETSMHTYYRPWRRSLYD